MNDDPKAKHPIPVNRFIIILTHLDNLLEGAVDGRPGGGVLPEVDRRHRALGDALGGELELLQRLLANLETCKEKVGMKRTW